MLGVQSNGNFPIPELVDHTIPPIVSVAEMPTGPSFTPAGRPMRNYRRPLRFDDSPPEPSASFEPLPLIPKVAKRMLLHVRDTFRTAVNQFGVLREYLHRPSYDPDASVKLEDL